MLSIFFGEVHPLDRWWLLFGVTVVGAIAGGLGAAVIGIIGVVRDGQEKAFQPERLRQQTQVTPADERYADFDVTAGTTT